MSAKRNQSHSNHSPPLSLDEHARPPHPTYVSWFWTNNGRMMNHFLCLCADRPQNIPHLSGAALLNERGVFFLLPLGVMVHGEVVNASLSLLFPRLEWLLFKM